MIQPQGCYNKEVTICFMLCKKFLVDLFTCFVYYHHRQIFHVIYDYFPKEGVVSMCFSYDGNELMTLTGKIPQVIVYFINISL